MTIQAIAMSGLAAVSSVPSAVGVEASGLPRPDARANDLGKEAAEALEGTWAMVSYTGDGDAGHYVNHVEGGGVIGKLVLRRNETMIMDPEHISREEFQEGKAIFVSDWTFYRVDTGKEPKTIDFVIRTPEGVEYVSPGIYELKGDVFRICRGVILNGPRPTNFLAPKGSKSVLAVWKREKRGS